MKAARQSEAGFTLIELLVALAIFALISVAGVTLLRSGTDTQIAVKERLGEMALSQRRICERQCVKQSINLHNNHNNYNNTNN